MTRFQAAPVWAAYEAQRDLLRPWLAALPADAWRRPSVLERWSVLELVRHVAHVPAAAATVIAAGATYERPLSLGAYTQAWAGNAVDIADFSVAAAEGLGPSEVLAILDEADRALATAMPSVTDELVVAGNRGPLRAADYLATRVNELVVHAGDLSRSVPEVEPVPVDRKALAVSCRMLTTVLADRHPGHTLEVRVPPFAAVQCVEGPRHTRGTPPNVVETDPSTWVLIAAGRMPYADAVGQGLVKASGLRADLGPYLPLF
jgi:uncharacterized protein (TIGR03083 family)